MPKSVLSRRRSYVARFLALAMVASLMAIGAAPASAAVVDTTDACPTTTPSAGFTDIGALDATTQRAIDCLGAYNITKGTSATTYSPNGEVARWQMALFLIRQAEVHGIAMPSGAHQGFNDIAGLNAETQIAINRLAQLDITKGTSATTFDPNGIVTRWQMALFLSRLVDEAPGVSLPSGAPQGYTDLGGLSAEAILAINQVTQLGIAEGVGGGQFAPFANTLRWQMALFLTRTLQVGGVTPTHSLVTIAPSDAVTLNAGQSRTFTATFVHSNGTPYVGAVGISVRKTTAGNPVATATRISATTDALAGVGTATVTGFPGANGQVTFTITNTTTETVVVRAWQDSSPTNQTFDAGEPSAMTGVITFSSVAPNAAVSGSYTVTVNSTIKADNTFVGTRTDGDTNCGNGVAQRCTFSYDDNDIFTVDAAAATLAGFEAALSQADTVVMTYSATAANQSNFALTDAVADLTVTAPATAVTVDAGTYTVTGKADPGATVRVYRDPSGDGQNAEAGEVIVTTTTASVDGAYSVAVTLSQNAVNDFFVTQIPVGEVVEQDEAQVPRITEGPVAGFTLTSATITSGNALIDPVDSITLVFSEAVANIGSGASITVTDVDGTTGTLTVGTNVTATRTAANSYTFTVTGFPTISVAGATAGVAIPAQIIAASGIVDATDGTALSFPSSSDRILN